MSQVAPCNLHNALSSIPTSGFHVLCVVLDMPAEVSPSTRGPVASSLLSPCNEGDLMYVLKSHVVRVGGRARGQGSGVRGQGPGVRGQGSELRGQGSGVRGQGGTPLAWYTLTPMACDDSLCRSCKCRRIRPLHYASWDLSKELGTLMPSEYHNDCTQHATGLYFELH